MRTRHSKSQRRAMVQAHNAGGPSLHGVVWLQTNGHCWYCGSRISREAVTLDHKVPIVIGGQHQLANIVASCKPCNMAKGPLPLDAYRQQCGVEHFWGERT